MIKILSTKEAQQTATMIRDLNDNDVRIISLIENLERKGLEDFIKLASSTK